MHLSFGPIKFSQNSFICPPKNWPLFRAFNFVALVVAIFGMPLLSRKNVHFTAEGGCYAWPGPELSEQDKDSTLPGLSSYADVFLWLIPPSFQSQKQHHLPARRLIPFCHSQGSRIPSIHSSPQSPSLSDAPLVQCSHLSAYHFFVLC